MDNDVSRKYAITRIVELLEKDRRDSISFIEQSCWDMAESKGFHDKPVEDGTLIALIQAEASEALEELRKEQVDLKKFEEELADIVIRTFDLGKRHNLDVSTAIVDKLIKNSTRPYRHSKRF